MICFLLFIHFYVININLFFCIYTLVQKFLLNYLHVNNNNKFRPNNFDLYTPEKNESFLT